MLGAHRRGTRPGQEGEARMRARGDGVRGLQDLFLGVDVALI